ncbi:MAG: hypothetical protein CFH10_02074 [Alphaproteobacteria bacterium MarineAlpha4_Bin2]|nr:MAG: hypothetical protein CFH10_02074 [Alphaproteobacteria bacterium MarineAlpha4_Bin2]
MSAAHNSPIFNAPNAVKLIAAATLVAHVVRVYFLPGDKTFTLMVEMAFVPGRYSIEFLEVYGMNWSTFASPLTYMLVHGDFTHLLINVLLFLAFGAAVGRRMAFEPMVAFYILCGLAGAFAFWVFNLGELAPVIGASGAVAGAVGAVSRLSFLTHHPVNPMPFKNRSSTLAFISIWLIMNFFFGMLPAEAFGSSGGGIAWETHLGGFVFGFVAISWFDGRGLKPKSFEFYPRSHT